MDKKLLQKFFRNRCTPEETEEVYTWFQTDEGARWLEEHLDKDMERYADEENLLLYPEVPSERLYRRVRQTNRLRHQPRRPSYAAVKTAVAVLLCAVLAGLYWGTPFFDVTDGQTGEIPIRTVITQNDQHRLLTLADGTRVRLNANSTLQVPEVFPGDERPLQLDGEAWFQVAKDETRPFIVHTQSAKIEVLGTEFNVRAHPEGGNVQVAVAEGKVSLNSLDDDSDSIGAILTENTFAIYDIGNEDILIEHSPVENYLSWISGRLYFYSDPLWVVSRYLERIYDVEIRMDAPGLRERSLSLDLARDDLETVLDIIAKTLGIGYHRSGDTIIWTSDEQS